MTRLKFAVICILCFVPYLLHSQHNPPSYRDVVKNFYLNYSYTPEYPYHHINFAKKKQGWYVEIADFSDNDNVLEKQLFWNPDNNKYEVLNGFGPVTPKEEMDEKIDSMMTGNNSFLLYGYARCRYFGYPGWTKDMINDFSGAEPQNDTLLEGLARAYINYSLSLLWDYSGQNTEHTSFTKLGRLEMPGKDRIDSFNFYTNRGIEYYRILNRRNPNYKTIIGNPGMKILNELMNQFLELSMSGYNGEAKKIIDALPENDSTYLKIGYTYLNSCPLNSILITFGDNDTYPLWYVQQKKGYRKDVTVINNSLLGVAPYVNMLKKDRIVNFSTGAGFYGKEGYDYFNYDRNGPSNITSLPMPVFIKDLQEAKYTDPDDKNKKPLYRVKTIDHRIDLARLKKICNQNNLVTNIKIELNNYLLSGEFIILDIINTNIYSRPVCFTTNQTIINNKYLQQEGTVYRILPLNNKTISTNQALEVSKIENYLGKNPGPVLTASGDANGSFDDILFGLHGNLYAKLITYYSGLKNPKKSADWASKYLAAFQPDKINYGIFDYQVAEALLKTSFVKQGIMILEKIAQSILDSYKNFQPPGNFYSKKDSLGYLEYLDNLLVSNKQSSSKLKAYIEELKDKDDE